MAQPDIERILCCNVLDTETTHRSCIFRHGLYEFEEAIPWPPANFEDVACWHCCHSLPAGAQPICLPNTYDRKKGVFHVYGFFCSIHCAKAYLMEHSGFASGEKLLLLHYLAAKHFGHSGEVVTPAPPRHRLKMFGGDLSIEAFRQEHVYFTKTLSPPLISTPEVYERRLAGINLDARPHADSKLIENPPTAASAAQEPLAGASTSLFNNFVRQKRSASAELKPPREQSVPGTLSVFMKKQAR